MKRLGPKHGVAQALVAALLLAAASSLADADVKDLLAKAMKGPSTPYDGVQRTRLFTESGVSETRVRIFADGRGAVRREYASGPAAGTVLLQNNGTTWRKDRSGNWLRLPGAGNQDPDLIVRLMVANYDVAQGGTGTVAGRKAVEIHIKARQSFNPARNIWVDRSTGLILRDEMLGPDGRPRSSTEFVQVSYRAQPASLFAVEAKATPSAAFGPSSFEARPSSEAVAKETGMAVPMPGYIPPGYRPVTYGVMTTGRGFRTPAVRYSDGLASFSIFVRGAAMGGGPGPRRRGWGGPGGGGGPRRRQGPGGPPPAPTTFEVLEDRQQVVIHCSGSRNSYVVVGDLAASELTKVARSLP